MTPLYHHHTPPARMLLLLLLPTHLSSDPRRLLPLNMLGVAAVAMLAATAAALGATAVATGAAHPLSLLPRWELLGPTPGAAAEGLAGVIPVLVACYVAHQRCVVRLHCTCTAHVLHMYCTCGE